MIFKRFLIGFGIMAVIFTLIPLIPSDYWWIRMFDFPLIQLTAITLFAILMYYIKFNRRQQKDILFMLLLMGCFIFQFSKLIPYTPFHSKEVLDSTKNDKKLRLKLLTANVLQKNENNDILIDVVKKLDADILVFTEANTEWREAIVKNLTSEYKYKLELPLDNTYGILMYSKFELVDPEIKFQVTDTIPSIHSKVRLASGDLIQLYAIHPTPPMPQENPLSTDRDAEMMLTSRLARNSKIPVIVIGDFNDIPWSSPSTIFQHTSELLDVRVGRGFYNSFNADEFLLRWPLDHVYVSAEFRLNTMEICQSIDSDHFPYYVELSYEPDGANEQLPEPITEKELENAEEQLRKLEKKISKQN
ncbi:MAG: endonuclease/exonuclease/phosphatase family protein [Aquaticitalea sp.]